VSGLTRRHVLFASAALAGCGDSPVATFPTLASAIAAVKAAASGHRTRSGWPLAQVFDHAAQSVEYSMSGYPELKSALFRATVGVAAFEWFESRGRMSHRLDEAIPGAPALADDLAASAARLVRALERFEAHRGKMRPHFAYGDLDWDEYRSAHLMHLADHWTEIVST